MANGDELIPSIFDADNHYWDTSDAFTRHRDARFTDRGVTVIDVDGKPRYIVVDADVGTREVHHRSRHRNHPAALKRTCES